MMVPGPAPVSVPMMAPGASPGPGMVPTYVPQPQYVPVAPHYVAVPNVPAGGVAVGMPPMPSAPPPPPSA